MGLFQSRPLQTRLPEHVLRELRDKIGMDCVNYYNFGVCGGTGTGKSSLVNAFCGYKEGEAIAAAVGHYDVGTTQTRAYKPEKYPHVAIWDIPGTNHSTSPMVTYFSAQRLAAFDVLLIVSDANRFTEIDSILAKRAQSVGVPVIFVRTKGDVAVDEERKRVAMTGADTTDTTDEQVAARVKRSIKKSMVPELEKIGMATTLFVVISAFRMYGNNTICPPLDESFLIEQIEALAESRRRS